MYEGNAKEIATSKPLTFVVKSGKAVVSDPCYAKGTWCAKELENVRNGKWHAVVVYSDEGEWGIRVSKLRAWHESQGNELGPDQSFWDRLEDKFELGVDSGQMSIFDSEAYPQDPHKDQAFYDKVCEWTLSGPEEEELIKFGVYKPTGELHSKSGKDWITFQDEKHNEGKCCLRRGFDFEAAELDKDKLVEYIQQNGYGSFGGDEGGVASSSGFGDGGYPGMVVKDHYVPTHDVVGIAVDFICEGDEDEDGEDQ